MTIAELFYAKQQAGQGRWGGLPRPRPRLLPRRRKVSLEPLEPRLLLSGDPLKYALGAGVTDVMLKLVPDVNGTEVLQLIDDRAGSGGAVVASQPLAQTSEVLITGSARDDTLIVDQSTPFAVPVSFTDASASDHDRLQVLGGDYTWNVIGPDAGVVGDVTFAGVENLTGAADNRDTFVLAPGGSVSGLLDGGAGGYDRLLIQGGNYTSADFTATGPNSGTVGLDGRHITYAGLEPITLSAPVVDVSVDGTSAADNLVVDLDGGHLRVRSTNTSMESVSFDTPTRSLTINGQGGTDSVEVETDLIMPGASLSIDAETITVDTGVTINTTGGSGTGDLTFDAVAKDDGTLKLSLAGVTIPLGLDGAYFANPTAVIDLTGANITANAINLSAQATSEFSAAPGTYGSFQATVGYAKSDAEIRIVNATITAASLTAEADSTVTITAIDNTSPASDSDSSTDAGISVVVVDSDALTYVSGTSDLNITGALVLGAKNDIDVSSVVDTTLGGSGATVAVGVLDVDTESYIKGSATVDAGSIRLTVDTQNSLAVVSQSTMGGATDNDSGTTSKTQQGLTDNQAGTSEGSLSIAGTLAVGVVTSHSKAYVSTSNHVTSTGTLDIWSTSLTNSQTRADGSPSVADEAAGSGNGNIGIGVGIGVGDLHNDAYVGGTGSVTAGGLSVKAATGTMDRTLNFTSANLDAAKGTIDLARKAHGLKTGEAIVYHKTGGKTISELHDGQTYYVVLQDDGKIMLSENADGSSPKGSFTIGGTGDDTFDFTFAQTDSRLGVTAIAGASGGSTGVAGALVINVGISKTSAIITDSPTVNIAGSGAVEIKAENFIEATSKGTGKQAGGTSTGVGAVFSLNIGETDTEALLGDGTTISGVRLTGAGAVTLSAASKNVMDNMAEGAAASAKTSVTPVVAISIANNTTGANLDARDASITQTNSPISMTSLNVTASHEGSNDVSAVGNTESGDTGVGISLALAITTDSAIATTARDLTALGAIAFEASMVSLEVQRQGERGRRPGRQAGRRQRRGEEGRRQQESRRQQDVRLQSRHGQGRQGRGGYERLICGSERRRGRLRQGAGRRRRGHHGRQFHCPRIDSRQPDDHRGQRDWRDRWHGHRHVEKQYRCGGRGGRQRGHVPHRCVQPHGHRYRRHHERDHRSRREPQAEDGGPGHLPQGHGRDRHRRPQGRQGVLRECSRHQGEALRHRGARQVRGHRRPGRSHPDSARNRHGAWLRSRRGAHRDGHRHCGGGQRGPRHEHCVHRRQRRHGRRDDRAGTRSRRVGRPG
jgi:hypothetical protein